jgi:UDP-2-acetamido-3-amino-2,3-dideoxy-glucuronate N-acetyltransferase
VKIETLSARAWLADPSAARDLGIGAAALVRLHTVVDSRGELNVGEMGRGLPFMPRRFFTISRVPSMDIRGEHAHRQLQQLLVCLSGSVVAEVNDGERSRAVSLDCPQVGLHIPPMIWGAQHHYTHDAVLLVLASREYDPDDYIRDFGEFASLRNTR